MTASAGYQWRRDKDGLGVWEQGVHQHRPLPYQQVAGSMQHQYGLLFSGS